MMYLRNTRREWRSVRSKALVRLSVKEAADKPSLAGWLEMGMELYVRSIQNGLTPVLFEEVQVYWVERGREGPSNLSPSSRKPSITPRTSIPRFSEARLTATVTGQEGSQGLEEVNNKCSFTTNSTARNSKPLQYNARCNAKIKANYCQLSPNQPGVLPSFSSSSATLIISSPNNPLAHPNHALLHICWSNVSTLSWMTRLGCQESLV